MLQRMASSFLNSEQAGGSIMAPLSMDDTVAITANKKSNEVNLEELQAQLASIIAERDAALEKCNKLEAQIGASSDQSGERCLFLDKLPIEIRKEIYALLLTNDVLSEWRSMNNWGVNAWGPPAPGTTFEYTPIYDLSPELLRTCRQIYVEGCEILYGSNTYIIDCTMSEAFYSPIVRNAGPTKGWYPRGVSHGSNPDRMKDIPAIKKVQHWKIFLSTDEEVCHDTIPQSLSGLCEAIHNTPAKSIRVFIVPQGDMFRNMDPWHTRGNSVYHKIELLLQPLRILRNISEFELREASVDEVRNFIPSADMSLLKPLKFLPGFKEELKSLVQRSEPSVSISQTYDNLLAYAQSFEQQPRYKQAMNPIYGDYRARYEYADGLDETIEVERVEDINYFVPRTDISLLHPRRGDTSFSPLNPFMRHPVEMSLSLAAAGCEIQNLKMLKRGRGSVLELLEPQYQKVLAASRNFANVVKYYKVPGKIFDVNLQRDMGNWIDFHSSGDALMALEDYAGAFARDIPESIRRQIRGQKRTFDLAYSFLPSRRLIDYLGSLLEDGRDPEEFYTNFKLAADVLDKQFLQIRATRKALFEHDTGDWGCGIDLQLNLVDEMVDWSVNEPDMTPQSKPVGWDLDQNEQDGN